MAHPIPFELPITIQSEDIDLLGHVNNVVYVRWVQDAAVAHWQAEAAPEDQAALFWVVVRHEIDYKRPAFLGDEVLARTWVGPASPKAFERNTELIRARDGALLAKARTLWCPVDSKTLRPAQVRPEVWERFSTGPA